MTAIEFSTPVFKEILGTECMVLELIIILSWILHKYLDAYIVLGLLLFNAIIGFIQEHNAVQRLWPFYNTVSGYPTSLIMVALLPVGFRLFSSITLYMYTLPISLRSSILEEAVWV
jgi:hypothetical protein